MWIYEQEKTEENLSLLPQTVSLPVQKAEPALPTVPATAPEPVEQLPSKEPCIPAKRHATRDCWLLAAAFLLGSSAAGVLQAVCDARQAELLRYYLEAWQGLFAPGSMQGTVQLFSMEYLALGLVVSLFLVLGLSALGPIMIFGSMMLYGLGSGLLMVQLCTAGGWKQCSRHCCGQAYRRQQQAAVCAFSGPALCRSAAESTPIPSASIPVDKPAPGCRHCWDNIC